MGNKWRRSQVKDLRGKQVNENIEAEAESPLTFGFNGKIEADSLIVCHGTKGEFPAKVTLSFVSAVFESHSDYVQHSQRKCFLKNQLGIIRTSTAQRPYKTRQKLEWYVPGPDNVIFFEIDQNWDSTSSLKQYFIRGSNTLFSKSLRWSNAENNL